MSVAGYATIESVSRSLFTLLEEGLRDITVDEAGVTVELASPGDLTGDDVHLSVYLYRIAPNGHVSNAEKTVEADGTVVRPPLALDLHYLLTALPTASDPLSADTYEQHRVLGRAIQVLQDSPVLRGIQPTEDARITMSTAPMDEVLNVWNTFPDEAYQLSVAYVVSPVLVASDRDESATPVASRSVREFVPSGMRDSDGEAEGGPGQ